MNINCMIVHMEYYTNPFRVRYQLSRGWKYPTYEVWTMDGTNVFHRIIERMTGVQTFQVPEFVKSFAHNELNGLGEYK